MCACMSESVLHSKILANHFKGMCRNYLPPYRKISFSMNQQKAQINGNVVFFLTQVARLIHEGKVNAEIFKDEIKRIKDLNILKVEILWFLHVGQILTLTEYIQFHERYENVGIIKHIGNQVFENILEYRPESSQIREAMLLDFVRTSFECHEQRTGNKVSFYQTLLDLIAMKLQSFCNYEDYNVDKCIEIFHFMELAYNSGLNSDTFKSWLQLILRSVLESSSQTFKSIFKMQDKVKNQVWHRHVFHFFTQLSKYCNLQFLLSELNVQIRYMPKRLNWEYMLCFISLVGQTYKDGWTKLKELSDSLLIISFQTLDAECLCGAFIIARQGCFEKINDSFPSYLQWFSSKFSSESKRPISSKKICNFFFGFLTEILPSEPAYYLKVHINKVPWVPSDCISILKEYVALVKAQLNVLNDSVELGICENFTDKSAPEFDVENVLCNFERTNNILSSVFQASMFCKEYYEKKFLVELLKKFEGEKSPRHRVILKLHSLGKIPNSMYKVYNSLKKK